jgi:hypothetical protein
MAVKSTLLYHLVIHEEVFDEKRRACEVAQNRKKHL